MTPPCVLQERGGRFEPKFSLCILFYLSRREQLLLSPVCATILVHALDPGVKGQPQGAGLFGFVCHQEPIAQQCGDIISLTSIFVCVYIKYIHKHVPGDRCAAEGAKSQLLEGQTPLPSRLLFKPEQRKEHAGM